MSSKMLRRRRRALTERNEVENGRVKKSEKRKSDAHFLTLEERIAVIKDFDVFPYPKVLAQKYQCGETQIRSIIRRREEYLQEWEHNADPVAMQLHRTARKKMLEIVILEWVRRANASQIPFDLRLLMHATTKLANCLNITEHKSSSEWMERFRKYHQLEFEECDPEDCGKSLHPNDIIEDLRPHLEALNGGKEIQNRHYKGRALKRGREGDVSNSSLKGNDEGSVGDNQLQSESQSDGSKGADMTQDYSMTGDYNMAAYMASTVESMNDDMENYSIETYEQALEILARIEQFAQRMNEVRAVNLISRIRGIFRQEADLDK